MDMDIVVIDADSKEGYPNLALMKLSAYHKQQGDRVKLIIGIPDYIPYAFDKIYASCIFFQNKERLEILLAKYPRDKVVYGGSAFLPDNHELPFHIEHILPDYDLYGLDFSLGFTSRGCMRRCPWCVVPSKEGHIRHNAHVSEFHDTQHNKIILLDNNFQASPRWKDNLDYVIDRKLKINFNQGLDFRLVDDTFAHYLSMCWSYNWTFEYRGLHFAFDSLSMEPHVRKGLTTLENHGINLRHVMVYVLVGFKHNTLHEQDLYRINLIKELGARPFVMLYNQTRDPELRRLARWVNRFFDQFIQWSDFR